MKLTICFEDDDNPTDDFIKFRLAPFLRSLGFDLEATTNNSKVTWIACNYPRKDYK